MGLSQRLVVSSLVTAAIACFFPYLFPPGRWDVPVRISVWISLVWFVTFVACIFRFRKKGLWFLVGAPLALYWPLVLLMIVVSCSLDARRCP